MTSESGDNCLAYSSWTILNSIMFALSYLIDLNSQQQRHSGSKNVLQIAGIDATMYMLFSKNFPERGNRRLRM